MKIKNTLYSYMIAAPFLFNSPLYAKCDIACGGIINGDWEQVGVLQEDVCATGGCSELCHGSINDYNAACNSKFSQCNGQCQAILWHPPSSQKKKIP